MYTLERVLTRCEVFNREEAAAAAAGTSGTGDPASSLASSGGEGGGKAVNDDDDGRDDVGLLIAVVCGVAVASAGGALLIRRRSLASIATKSENKYDYDEEIDEEAAQWSPAGTYDVKKLLGGVRLPPLPVASAEDTERILKDEEEDETTSSGDDDETEMKTLNPPPPTTTPPRPSPPPWFFDAFAFAATARSNPLTKVALRAFDSRGLIEAFGIDRRVLTRFLASTEALYKSDNPYHNATHAADVVQTLSVMLARVDPVGRGTS